MRTPLRERAAKSEQLNCREIGPQDLEILARFLEENNLPSEVGTFNPFPMTSETAKKIACLPRRDHYYGAFLDGRIIGLAMLRGWDEGYSVPSFGIIIDHRFQRLGMGSRMLDYTIDAGVQLGCSSIRLSVFASNQRAVHLYLSRGIVEDSREDILLSGESDERIIMFKEITS